MNLMTNMRYESAKEIYAKLGVDTEKAIETLSDMAVAMHCWQGDDVGGFDTVGALDGGIQTTGNYPGKARNPKELMADMEKALSLIPGKHKLNLHASYAIFEDGEQVDRDALEPKHFRAWVDFAKRLGVGIDFNPTFFSHPKATGLTLSHPDKEIRDFWIRHAQACLRIAEYFATELGVPSVVNIWIPDGMKDIPADRLTPRARLKDSLDQILSIDYDRKKVLVAVESKVFGIGLESYTVGSSEFYMNYAAKNGIMCLLDNGHYHPTEQVSDKLSSMLLFSDQVALHVTRPVRWDSDHVVILEDEIKEIAKEIVFADALDRVAIALDYFDASINRVAAWVIGMRNMQKALLTALLLPKDRMKALQEQGNTTELLMLSEEMKMFPVGDVWQEFCARMGQEAGEGWFQTVLAYEKEVLSARK